MNFHTSCYDEGHTALFQPQRQQPMLMLRRRNLNAREHCLCLRRNVNKSKLGAMPEVRIEAVPIQRDRNSHKDIPFAQLPCLSVGNMSCLVDVKSIYIIFRIALANS